MNKNLRRILLLSIPFISSGLIGQTRVNVTDFSVKAKEQKVVIDWKADGTTANYFAVQKSTDGVNFKIVAMVLGPDPKHKSGNYYGCVDKYVAATTQSYYRLVHVDTGGHEQITEAKLLAKP